MSKGGITVLIVAALVFAALGFVFGRVVNAANNTQLDVVSESYVQQYVGVMMAEMQTKIDELDMRILSLGGAPTASSTPEQTGTNNPSPAPTIPTPPAPTTVKIKTNGVNVRADASTTADIVGGVTENTVLTYLGQKNGADGRAWYNVRLANGAEGWVASWLCYEPE